jgi:hypothetical protein
MHKALVEALCILPYSKVESGENEITERVFDYAEVIAKARELSDARD